jgi:hypothetical protein
MNNEKLIEAQKDAVAAFSTGVWIADRNAKLTRTNIAKPVINDLGRLLDDPAAFWSKAAAVEAFGERGEGFIEPLMLANRIASAQIAVGNLDYIRDSLIGQAQWLGVVAIKMMSKADELKRADLSTQYIKLAFAAQRQAAQCLASAAALDKLEGAKSVTVG